MAAKRIRANKGVGGINAGEEAWVSGTLVENFIRTGLITEIEA